MQIPSLTITQYLIQGDPEGLISCYVSNWNGQCLKFPRNLLGEARKRSEFSKTGIYFLISCNPEDFHTWRVYVGETDGLEARIIEHDRKKDWEHCIVFFSKDDTLTKSLVRYLEHLLQESLRRSQRVKLDNYNSTKYKLPEAEIAMMDTYFEYIKLLLPVLGYPFFEQRQPGALGVKEQMLYLHVSKFKAEGYLTPRGIMVKAGSNCSPQETGALGKSYVLLRRTLAEQGVIDLNAGKFLADYQFDSVSAGAAVIVGYNINGRNIWKNNAGRLINEQEQNLAAS